MGSRAHTDKMRDIAAINSRRDLYDIAVPGDFGCRAGCTQFLPRPDFQHTRIADRRNSADYKGCY